MATTVKLDSETVRRTVEIDNVRTDAVLPTKFRARQAAITVQSPQNSFGDGRVLSKLACPHPHVYRRRLGVLRVTHLAIRFKIDGVVAL